MHSERYSALACIIHQIIDIKVEGALREAPLFVRVCEIVLDLYNPFINRTKQMTAPSPLLSDVIVILAHYQASDPLYKSLRGCPSSVSATYCDCVGSQSVRNSSSACLALLSLSVVPSSSHSFLWDKSMGN